MPRAKGRRMSTKQQTNGFKSVGTATSRVIISQHKAEFAARKAAAIERMEALKAHLEAGGYPVPDKDALLDVALALKHGVRVSGPYGGIATPVQSTEQKATLDGMLAGLTPEQKQALALQLLQQK